MDPRTATREQFTQSLLSKPVPADAARNYKILQDKLSTTLRLLAYHTAMVDTGNLQQAFMTPAASKNSVYFMWDFVGRTLVSLPRALF